MEMNDHLRELSIHENIILKFILIRIWAKDTDILSRLDYLYRAVDLTLTLTIQYNTCGADSNRSVQHTLCHGH